MLSKTVGTSLNLWPLLKIYCRPKLQKRIRGITIPVKVQDMLKTPESGTDTDNATTMDKHHMRALQWTRTTISKSKMMLVRIVDQNMERYGAVWVMIVLKAVRRILCCQQTHRVLQDDAGTDLPRIPGNIMRLLVMRRPEEKLWNLYKVPSG